MTAFQKAFICGYIKIALKFLEFREEVNPIEAIIHGQTILDGSKDYDCLDIVQMLLNIDVANHSLSQDSSLLLYYSSSLSCFGMAISTR